MLYCENGIASDAVTRVNFSGCSKRQIVVLSSELGTAFQKQLKHSLLLDVMLDIRKSEFSDFGLDNYVSLTIQYYEF